MGNKEQMDPYAVLELSLSATQADIKRAFRRLASRTHPDKGGSAESFNQAKRAFDALALRRGSCELCEGKGHIETRNGAFVKKENCPRCWAPLGVKT